MNPKGFKAAVPHLTAAFCTVFLLFCSPVSGRTLSGQTLPGPYLFKAGDDLSWADPGLDDGDWSAIHVPGAWQDQGFRAEGYMGWYRIRFTVKPEMAAGGYGIFLGEIGNADETFLNGVRIGKTGRIGRWFVESRTDRLYKIPDGLLVQGKVNCLAVRVLSLEPGSGLVRARPVLGPFLSLLHQKHQKDRIIIIEETVFLTVYLVLLVSSLIFFLSGARDREYLCFMSFALLGLVGFLIESTAFYQAGLKNALAEAVILGACPLFPICLLCFFIHFCGGAMTRPIRLLYRFSLLFALVTLLMGNYTYASFTVLGYVWFVQILVVSLIAIRLIWSAVVHRVPEYLPVTLGSLCLILCGILYVCLFFAPFSRFYVSLIRYDDYFFLVFMICIVYALGMRFTRLQRKALSLSGRILEAHENERKRLARELHDGLGQRLLAVKFNLQRLRQRVGGRELDDVISQTSEGIEDLREISMGLRPALLDKAGLDSVIRGYTGRIARESGISVAADISAVPRLDPRVEDNLFRIFQEAVSNALKYSHASRISVALQRKGAVLELVVEDNGVGFDFPECLQKGDGMGLSTMQERADLLGAKLSIRSRKDRGTRIQITIGGVTI